MEKNIVEECWSIDTKELVKNGIFKKESGYHWVKKYYSPTDIFKVVTKVQPTRLVVNPSTGNGTLYLRFSTYEEGTEKDKNDLAITVESSACHFGGVRWWFRCSGINGRECDRRSRILHMPPDSKEFRCRDCYSLAYQSQQMHGNELYEGLIKPHKIMRECMKMIDKKLTVEEAIAVSEISKDAIKTIEDYKKKQMDRKYRKIQKIRKQFKNTKNPTQLAFYLTSHGYF